MFRGGRIKLTNQNYTLTNCAPPRLVSLGLGTLSAPFCVRVSGSFEDAILLPTHSLQSTKLAQRIVCIIVSLAHRTCVIKRLFPKTKY